MKTYYGADWVAERCLPCNSVWWRHAVASSKIQVSLFNVCRTVFSIEIRREYVFLFHCLQPFSNNSCREALSSWFQTFALSNVCLLMLTCESLISWFLFHCVADEQESWWRQIKKNRPLTYYLIRSPKFFVSSLPMKKKLSNSFITQVESNSHDRNLIYWQYFRLKKVSIDLPQILFSSLSALLTSLPC